MQAQKFGADIVDQTFQKPSNTGRAGEDLNYVLEPAELYRGRVAVAFDATGLQST